MKSCSFRRILKSLCAAVLVLCLAAPVTAMAAPGGINTKAGFAKALENAADGATLLVDDIDFEAKAEPIRITKSITVRSAKERGSAVFSYGAFILDGSAADITVTFENITFYSDADASMVENSVWDGDVRAYAPALTVSGNVSAALKDCVFRNYMSIEGANISARCEAGDRITLTADNCSFLGNAVRDRGGAVLLLGSGEEGSLSFTAENCSFAGNLSSDRKNALGGGAVYAEKAALHFTACSFSANEASHAYLVPETAAADAPADTADASAEGDAEGADTDAAEPVYADYTDTSKGGAVFAKDSSLTMKNCRVTQNSASLGGGIALENSEFRFLSGILAQNRAESAVVQKDHEGLKAGTGMGGGLYVKGDRTVPVLLINSSVYGNSALNAYGGIFMDGAGVSTLPYSVDLLLCTYSENTADTAYNKPEVDREDFAPETEEPAESEAEDEGELTEEEKAAAQAEAEKKAAEAEKAAEEAYEKAVAEALAAAEWTEVPGDIWNLDALRARASLIIDDSFSSLKRHKVAFPRYEKPNEVNYHTYFAAPENALADGFMPVIPAAEFTHVAATESFRSAFPLPDGMAQEILSPFYAKILGTYFPGDNAGGALTYQLMLDNAVWKTVEAAGQVTPILPIPEKAGHSFDLWQAPDGTPYVEGEPFVTGLSSQTLQVTAVMHPNTYVLHFKSEAGTQDVQQVYGMPVTLPAASPKTGYDFVNWYKADGTPAKDGEAYTFLGDSTYVAQYSKQFPTTVVIILSAAIFLIALYLLITMIADHRKSTQPEREAKKAEKAAAKEAEKAAKEAEKAAREAEKAAKKEAREAEAQAEEAAAEAAELAEAAEDAEAKAAETAEEAAGEAAGAVKETAEEVTDAVKAAADGASPEN